MSVLGTTGNHPCVRHVVPLAPPVSETNDDFIRRVVMRLIASKAELSYEVILGALNKEMASS